LDGLDKLPAWIQVAVFLGVLIATTVASASGWMRDKWFKRPSSAPSPNLPSKDAVVMSAAIADSQAINNLATGINRLVDFLEQDREDQERRDRAMRTCIQELLDSNDRVAGLLRQALHPFGFGGIARPGQRPPEDS
jgi:hypothetical protein